VFNTKISKVLSRLEEQSKRERLGEVVIPRPEMMLAITLDTGMFFNITLKAMRAKRILEIGTSSGYSTLWFAEALMQISEVSNTRQEKTIITIEMDHSKIERANKNFDESGVKDLIERKAKQTIFYLRFQKIITMKIISKMKTDYLTLYSLTQTKKI
jgi:predicted O-methyltransferase YrrM